MIFKFFLHNNGFGDAGSAARSGRWNQIRYYHHRVEQKHSNKRVFWRSSLWLAGWLAGYGWSLQLELLLTWPRPFLFCVLLSLTSIAISIATCLFMCLSTSSLGLFSDAPSYRKPGRASTMGGGWV